MIEWPEAKEDKGAKFRVPTSDGRTAEDLVKDGRILMRNMSFVLRWAGEGTRGVLTGARELLEAFERGY